MDDYEYEESLDNEMQETFKEGQQKAIMSFCKTLNPKSTKDKPLYSLCNTLKNFGIEPDPIVEPLRDNQYIQFFNSTYIAMVIIYENGGAGSIEKFCKTHNLDLADFIRYQSIVKKFL